ncbi:16785_t:CDS:10, partial [Gigaspora rosea]
KNVSSLYHALKLHRRCRKDVDPTVKQSAVAIIYMLTNWFPQFSDWHELVKNEEHGDVEKVIKEYTNVIKKPKMPPLKGVALPPPSLYFDRDVTRVLKMFRTSLTEGLPKSEIPLLLDHYGPNQLPKPPKTSIFSMILNQLKDFMVLILIAATIVTAALSDFKDMGVLLFVIVLNTIIGFTQEYKATKALEALQKLTVPKAQVVRDGQQMVIDSSQLVPGDIVVLEEGDAVPADIRIVESSHLEVIESILTGESLPVSKDTKKIWTATRHHPLGECKGNAFMSTTIARGRGKGVVVRTGNDTEIGKISAAITSVKQVKTPIQRKLAKLGKWLVLLAFVLCILVVIIGVAYRHNAIKMVFIGLSLAVSVIPEGLVAVTTVTMAIGVRRMAKRSAIVRTLPAVETLGSVTVICSDKTGTLTEGKMGPIELWIANDSLYTFTEPTSMDPNDGGILFLPSRYNRKNFESHEDSIKSLQKFENSGPQEISKNLQNLPSHLMTALMISNLCNNSSVIKEKGEWKGVGDPTEVGLLLAAQKGGFSKNYWEKDCGFTKIHEKAFDSERKLMSVVYEIKDTTSLGHSKPAKLVLAKGAPEQLLRKCTRYLPNIATTETGLPFDIVFGEKEGFQPNELSDKFVDIVSRQSSRMASRGLRILGLAFKRVYDDDTFSSPISSHDSEKNLDTPTNNPLFDETDLIFVGLIGLIDPPKKAVKESIRKCKEAGIQNLSILGAEFDMLSEQAIKELNPFPSVFARVSPDNKLKIVQALQNLGNSVAMTGDGVNASDIGIAMGINGTEITKQAADIVLANDDFSTIVIAVEEGRQVFDNILKFIVYLLSCNGAEIILMFLCAIINTELPFTTIMILFANIIADVPPAMSLGIEPAEGDIMRRKPRNPKSGVLNTYMTLILLMQAAVMALATFGVYKIGLSIENMDLIDAQSLAFATLTTMQLFQGFLSRTLNESFFKTPFFGNKWMIVGVFGSFAALVIGIYIPGVNDWFSLKPVPILGWAKIAICLILLIVFSEIGKVFGRRLRDK